MGLWLVGLGLWLVGLGMGLALVDLQNSRPQSCELVLRHCWLGNRKDICCVNNLLLLYTKFLFG